MFIYINLNSWSSLELTSLEGLENLTNLKALWAQGNQIYSIGSALDNSTKLKELSIYQIYTSELPLITEIHFPQSYQFL